MQFAPRHQTKITPALVKRMEAQVQRAQNRQAEFDRNRKALAQAAGKRE
jgi:hypothetical protein